MPQKQMKYFKCKMAHLEAGIPTLESNKSEVIQQNIKDISARSQNWEQIFLNTDNTPNTGKSL